MISGHSTEGPCAVETVKVPISRQTGVSGTGTPHGRFPALIRYCLFVRLEESVFQSDLSPP